MAQKIVVELIDDIDGSPATRTIHFSIEGAHYEIDLSDHNAEQLLRHLSPYVEAARKARTGTARTGKTRTAARSKAVSAKADSATIRAWAAANGYDLAPRGRIPAKIVEAFEAAHP